MNRPHLPVYNNNVLDLIKSQQNWSFSNIPYVFKITENNFMIISYYDSLGGYLQGTVSFDASFAIIDSNNIQITPISLISSATNRWPQNQTWKLTYVSPTQLILNNGTNINLQIY